MQLLDGFLSSNIHIQGRHITEVVSKNPLYCVFSRFKILAMKKQTLLSLQSSKLFLLPTSQRCHLCSFFFSQWQLLLTINRNKTNCTPSLKLGGNKVGVLGRPMSSHSEILLTIYYCPFHKK